MRFRLALEVTIDYYFQAPLTNNLDGNGFMLKEEVETAKRLVNTDTVQITVGEIASMYSARELNILPDFQRLFRWSPEKKSNFIESILIGIPVPPAFAYERDDGTWKLIDGLQRISTILEFMGVLRSPDEGDRTTQSKLVAAKYLPSLNNVVWNAQHAEEGETHELDRSLQLFFRRARIDFQVLKSPSDARTKFDLFQRLNRGGAYANEQEVRSCAMVLANSNFTRQIKEMAASEVFVSVFRIGDNQKLDQTNVEYAVRSIVHTHKDFVTGTDVEEFLDKKILEILFEMAAPDTLAPVEWSVTALHEAFGERALLPPEDAPAGIGNRFSLRALEAIVVGLARNSDAISSLPNVDQFVRDRTVQFWHQPEIQEMSAAGMRGTTRLQRTIPFGTRWFSPNG